MIHKTFEELVREADGIVEARIQDVVSRKFDDGMIYTYVTLADIELFKGAYKDETLTLILEGGFVDGRGLYVGGSPIMRQGERIIAFIRGNGQQIVPFVGWEQGLFRIIDNARTGERVISDSAGNPVFGIENEQVITKTLRPAQSEPFGLPARQSEPSNAGPGQPAEAGVGQWVIQRDQEPGVNLLNQSMMTRELFIQEIRKVLATQAVSTTQTLTSVRVGDRIEHHDQTYARPPHVEEPAKLRRVPETRGQLPIGVAPGTD